MIESQPNLGIILLNKIFQELTKFKGILTKAVLLIKISIRKPFLEKLRSVLASEIDFENEKYPIFDSSASLAP